MRIVVSILFLIRCLNLTAQSNHQLLKKADQLYLKQEYNKAEEHYRKSLEKNPNEKTKYNLGNAIMEQNRPQEAIPQYEQATKKQNQPDVTSKAWFNLGNAYFQQKQFDKSIQAYKNSLKQKPDDLDAKKNLSLAKIQLKKQQQQQQQQDQNQQKKQDQNQQQQQQQNQQQDNKDPKQDAQAQDQPQNPSEQQKGQLSKSEAEQLLDYMEREDQRVQQKITAKNQKTKPPKKDW